MGLIRLLVFAALIYLIWRLAKRLLPARHGDARRPAEPDKATAQRMLKCQQCGVHVPEHEAFQHNGLSFCCQSHQRQYLEHHER
ncbi:PP0621 family protein [Alloalcanivorax mobilis]|uniref:PP0621 family protein n=1 Tax=Alloalcanivorax mobilis TaxID=2019569 RepID=UPI000B5B3D74|nr:PP0621 family protein [Alloalcanivorax mobilis]ASK35065.1 hypothetical protein CEK62_12085 [Alcanivorax sp. N3-2A]